MQLWARKVAAKSKVRLPEELADHDGRWVGGGSLQDEGLCVYKWVIFWYDIKHANYVKYVCTCFYV